MSVLQQNKIGSVIIMVISHGVPCCPSFSSTLHFVKLTIVTTLIILVAFSFPHLILLVDAQCRDGTGVISCDPCTKSLGM